MRESPEAVASATWGGSHGPHAWASEQDKAWGPWGLYSESDCRPLRHEKYLPQWFWESVADDQSREQDALHLIAVSTPRRHSASLHLINLIPATWAQ